MKLPGIPWRNIVFVQLLFAAIIGFAGWNLVRYDDRVALDRAIQTVSETGTRVSTAIATELAIRDTIAESVAATAAISPDIDPDEFDLLAGTITGDRKDIINIAYAPGLVVRHVYPFDRNQSVLGLDYAKPTPFGAGVAEALESNETVLVGPIDIMQGGRALILRVPVGGLTATAESPPSVVSLVLDLDAFVASTRLETLSFGLNTAAYTTLTADGARNMIFGDAATCDGTPVRQNLQIYSQVLSFCLAPIDGWPTQGVYRTQIVAISLFSMILSTAILLIINRSRLREMEAKQMLLDAIEAIDDGFALFDANDRLALFNSRYREIYATSAPVLQIGRSFREIIQWGIEKGQYPTAKGQEEEWLNARMDAHLNPKGSVEQKLSDGRWIKVEERPLTGGGIVGFRVDITDLKRAREEAEASAVAMSEFLNNINHEIRTPLTVIVGFIRFLAKPDLLKSHRAIDAVLADPDSGRESIRNAVAAYRAETKSYAERVQNSSEHLLELVQDTLDLSKAQTGALSFNPQIIDLNRLLSDCLQQFSHQSERKGLKLTLDNSVSQMWADPLRLRQIMTNLIGNAVKFTPKGEITVSAKAKGNLVTLCVQDTGPGISAENHARVFEKFWQADGSTNRGHGGTGLGLAICRVLAELHGGRIWLDTDYKEGARFCLSLSLQEPGFKEAV